MPERLTPRQEALIREFDDIERESKEKRSSRNGDEVNRVISPLHCEKVFTCFHRDPLSITKLCEHMNGRVSTRLRLNLCVNLVRWGNHFSPHGKFRNNLFYVVVYWWNPIQGATEKRSASATAE